MTGRLLNRNFEPCLLGHSFRKMNFTGQNLKHVHVTYSLNEMFIFFD